MCLEDIQSASMVQILFGAPSSPQAFKAKSNILSHVPLYSPKLF